MSMKQNEYFVFPNEQTGFKPNELDLLKSENYHLINPNLYRVQKIATKDYTFRHHLETNVETDNKLKGVTWIRTGLSNINNIMNNLNSLISAFNVGFNKLIYDEMY